MVHFAKTNSQPRHELDLISQQQNLPEDDHKSDGFEAKTVYMFKTAQKYILNSEQYTLNREQFDDPMTVLSQKLETLTQNLLYEIRLEQARDNGLIDDLHLSVFGPGQYARSAFRIRERAPHDLDLSFVAVSNGTLFGSVRLTRGTLARENLARGTLADKTLADKTLAGRTLAGGTLAGHTFDPASEKDDQLHDATQYHGALLGPLAIDNSLQGEGVGRNLLNLAVNAAQEIGLDFILLVGDFDYYAPSGFACTAPNSVCLPGPADPARILIHDLQNKQITPSGMFTSV